jgi:hypothetical protein
MSFPYKLKLPSKKSFVGTGMGALVLFILVVIVLVVVMIRSSARLYFHALPGFKQLTQLVNSNEGFSPFAYGDKQPNVESEPLSYQKTSLYDQEYINPDDGKPKVKRFVNDTIKIWSQETIDDFLAFQLRQNPGLLFDMDIIQQQASESEVKELLRTGKWKWSERTIQIYKDVLSRNNYIKRAPLQAIDVDQTIYNQDAILHILGLNEPEGRFLLYGVRTRNEGAISDYNGRGTYGISSGLVHPDIYSNSIKCNKGKLQIQKFKGYNKGLTGEAMFEMEDLAPEKLPKVYKDFSFINQPCNPCVGLEFPYNNSCAFSVKPDKRVSPAWEKIWGLPPTSIRDGDLPPNYPFWIN